MSTALTVIRTIKNISIFALVAVVAYGAAFIDGRFTMLLVPPSLVVYLSDQNSSVGELVAQLPIFIFIRKILDNMGPTGSKVRCLLRTQAATRTAAAHLRDCVPCRFFWRSVASWLRNFSSSYSSSGPLK